MISVVLPLYNVEPYLDECIKSIVTQSYSDWELILIDDGSSDGSPKIAQRWLSKDSRIKYFRKDNGGVSSARNMGIARACGEYIMFVDSDDICHPRLLESLVSYMLKGIDIVGCTVEKFEEKFELHGMDNFISEKLISLDQIYTCYSSNGILHPPYGKVYRNGIIRDNNIRFIQNLQLGEDVLFNLEYFKYVKCGVFIDESFYYYRNTPKSLSKNIQKDYTDKQLRIISEKISFIQTYKLTYDLAPHAPGIVRDIAFAIIHSDATNAEKQVFIEHLQSNPIMSYCLKKGKFVDRLLAQVIRRTPSAILTILCVLTDRLLNLRVLEKRD